MVHANLHASSDFFKKLSIDFQQLKLTIQILETFASRASARAQELGDRRLLIILDQLGVFLSKIQYLLENLENLLAMVVVLD